MDEDDYSDIDGQQFNNVNYQQLKQSILLIIQGLGQFQQIGHDQVYTPKPLCINCLKELIKSIKQESQYNYQNVKQVLYEYNMINEDIIPMLKSQQNDKRLSYYLTIIMVQLTDYQSAQQASNSNSLVGQIQNIKQSVINNNVIQIMVQHLADCIQNQNESKYIDQMIELVLSLVSNLLQIPNPKHQQLDLQYNLIINMHQNNLLSALVYLSSDQSEQEQNRLRVLKQNGLLFQTIFYNILKHFQVEQMIDIDGVGNDQYLEHVLEQNQKLKRRLRNRSSRHSRFNQTNIEIVRQLDNTKKVVKSIEQIKQVQFNQINNQRKQPRIRNTQKLKDDNSLSIQMIDLRNDQQMKLIIYNFSIDFMENSYNEIMNECQGSKDERIMEELEQYYFLYEYGLKINNRLYEKKREKEIRIDWVFSVVEVEQYVAIVDLMQWIVDQKRADTNTRLYYRLVKCVIQYIQMIKYQQQSCSAVYQQNAEQLNGMVYQRSISRLLKKGFQYRDDRIADWMQVMLKAVQVVYSGMQQYLQGRSIRIQVHNKRKNQAKQSKQDQQEQEEDDIEQFIEKDSNDDKHDGDSGKDGDKDGVSLSSDSERDDGLVGNIQYKQSSLSNEFSQMICYEMMTQMLEQLVKQPNSESCLFILQQIVEINGQWLLFQMDYLMMIMEIVDKNRKTNRVEIEVDKILRNIVREYFRLLSDNQMLIVESMFRFQAHDMREQLYNNYQYSYQQVDQHVQVQSIFYKEWTYKEEHKIKQIINQQQQEQQQIVINYLVRDGLYSLGIVDKTIHEIDRKVKQIMKQNNRQIDRQTMIDETKVSSIIKGCGQQMGSKIVQYLQQILQKDQQEIVLYAVDDWEWDVIEWHNIDQLFQLIGAYKTFNQKWYRLYTNQNTKQQLQTVIDCINTHINDIIIEIQNPPNHNHQHYQQLNQQSHSQSQSQSQFQQQQQQQDDECQYDIDEQNIDEKQILDGIFDMMHDDKVQ